MCRENKCQRVDARGAPTDFLWPNNTPSSSISSRCLLPRPLPRPLGPSWPLARLLVAYARELLFWMRKRGRARRRKPAFQDDARPSYALRRTRTRQTSRVRSPHKHRTFHAVGAFVAPLLGANFDSTLVTKTRLRLTHTHGSRKTE